MTVIRFCTRCGTILTEYEGRDRPFGFDRVCDRCGMGVILTAPPAALPGPGAPFLIVTRGGVISAVSEPAEALVGEETVLLGMPIASVLASAEGDEQLAYQIARAAGARREVSEATVTLSGPGRRPGARERLTARIASCSRPRAALLVLEPQSTAAGESRSRKTRRATSSRRGGRR